MRALIQEMKMERIQHNGMQSSKTGKERKQRGRWREAFLCSDLSGVLMNKHKRVSPGVTMIMVHECEGQTFTKQCSILLMLKHANAHSEWLYN